MASHETSRRIVCLQKCQSNALTCLKSAMQTLDSGSMKAVQVYEEPSSKHHVSLVDFPEFVNSLIAKGTDRVFIVLHMHGAKNYVQDIVFEAFLGPLIQLRKNGVTPVCCL